MDTKNFAIGVLGVTATILFVGLVILQTVAAPTAMAAGQNDRGGDYIMVTGQIDGAAEFLYVLDTQVPSLAAYRYDTNTGALAIMDVGPLNRMLQRAGR